MIQRTSWLSPMMHVIVSVGIGIAIGYGSHLILTHQITSGNFVSFITALIMLYTPIKNLGNNFNAVQFSFMAIERVFGILEQKPAIVDKPDAIELKEINHGVSFKNVSFEYVKGRPVLKNINLEVKKGETIALVGNSGGGKSTIVSLIPRFYDIQSGSITVDGVDIRHIRRENLRSNIAMVLQDTHLFTGTVRENIRYGRLDATDEEVEQAAKTASAHSFIMRLPHGYDTMLEGDGANLSQGQRQLLNIARAAVSRAPILILDEATSSVDTRTEKHIEHGMDRLMADRTTFVIAHRLSTVRNADAIMVLEQGEIIERGNHEQLLAQKGRYYELYTGLKELD